MTLDRLRRIVRLRLRSLLDSASVDRELEEELHYHLARQVEANIASGMTPERARLAALHAIGGLEQRKEECRDTRGLSAIENLSRDVRLALRQLRRQPGFALTAVLSLALGIGANTAIFQLLNALSLRRLPVRAPHELVEIRLTGNGRDGRHTGRNRQVSLPQYLEFAERQQAFSSILAFGDTRFNLAPAGEVRYVDGLWVSGSFFETLGIQPIAGRLIAPADDRTGCGATSVAVISYALWQSEFGGRPDIVGQLLPFRGSRVPIVGVTPRGFFGLEVGRQFGVAMPLCASGIDRSDHWWLAAIGRLKPGWTRHGAAAQLAQVIPAVQRATMPRYRPELAAAYLGMGVEVVDASSGVSPLRRSYQEPLWVLMAISSLVLLMASVNLANLLLARASARQTEFAVRLSLGASRWSVLRQVLVESGVIAVLGSLSALGVGWLVSHSIPPLISTSVDRIHLDLSLDWRVFGFAVAAAIATSLVFGSAPALRAARSRLQRGADRGGAGNQGLRLRRGLVALQIAVTLVLLFGGLLFLRTFRNLSTTDTGVHERGVLVASVFFSERTYSSERRRAAFRDLDERIFNLPGVESAADAYTTPLGGSIWDTDVETDAGDSSASNGNRVGPGYFATLGTRLIAGRDFDSRDVPGSPRVAIVNQSFAARFFDGNPIGRRFSVPDDAGGPGRHFQIVGLVADQKYADLREAGTRVFFTASSQEEPSTTRRYIIRSAGAPADMMAAVSAAVRAFDPALSIRYALLDTQIREAMLQEHLMARLSAIFGGVALLLAMVGLYGVVSYTVVSRRSEMGVRVALGASRSRILTMVLMDVTRMLIVGVAAGSILALLAGRGVGSLLFGIEPDDPATLATAAAALLTTGLIAAFWPARRAAGVDPVSALREG